MKNSLKFWSMVVIIILFTFFMLGGVFSFIATGIISLTMFLLLLFTFMDEEGEKANRPKEEYNIHWRINFIYWIRRFNRFLDDL